MAHLTRRNMLTASLTTVASGVFKSAAAAPKGTGEAAQVSTPEKAKLPESKFLVTLQNPISGGDAVPVGIKIAPAWNRNANLISAVLRWEGKSIAVFKLGKLALALGILGRDVKFATRIKIPADTRKGKLSVDVTIDGPEKLQGNQSLDLEITRCDHCSATNHEQLVLATQPAPFSKNKAVAVKSYVPKPVPASRFLTRIDCIFDRPADQSLNPREALPDYEVIRVEINEPTLLADEVFLAVDFLPSQNGLLEMMWTYHPDNTILQERAYLTPTS